MSATRRHVSRLPHDPFVAGPFSWLLVRLPASLSDDQRWVRRMLLVTLVSWAPLGVFTWLEGLGGADAVNEPLLLDINAYGRYLVAAPLLVIAGAFCLRWMAKSAKELIESGIITSRDRPAFEALLDSTYRLLTSGWTGFAIAVLAYVLTIVVSPYLYPASSATWIKHADGSLTLAGWWRILVSQPLFVSLQGIWVWRMLLWTRYLWRVSRFDLALVASHPDHLGGLGFMLLPLRPFTLLALAAGAIGAATVGENVIAHAATLSDFWPWIAAHVVLVVTILAAPMLLLSRPLLALQAAGTLTYGRLAHAEGRQFEERWIDPSARSVDSDALAVPDFSATTDLYSIVANIGQINPFVLDLRPVIPLAVATLLPYVPVVIYVMPIARLLELAVSALM